VLKRSELAELRSQLSQAFAEAAAGSDTSSRFRAYLSRLRSFSERMGIIEARASGHFWAAAVVVLGLGIALHQGRLGSLQIMDAHFDMKRFPVQAAQVMAEKQVREHKEKIPVAALNALEAAIASSKATLQNQNSSTAELTSRGEELQKALHAVSEALYKAEAGKAAGPQPDGAANGGPADGGQVVDADFTEEK